MPPLIAVRDMLGNHGFASLLQAKLTVGEPDDQYEQEADHVADRVMRMPDAAGDLTPIRSLPSTVQRKCAACEEEEEEAREHETSVQMKSHADAAAASPAAQPIPSHVAGRVEPLPACSGCTSAAFRFKGAHPGVDIVFHAEPFPGSPLDL